MDKIRIAVAGAGYIGQAHMDVARASPSCTLSAVVDPSPAAVALAAQAGVPLYASLEELIAKDRPDGVVLATPNQLHVPHALTCIAAGLPILLEKPIAPTVAEAESLLRVVDERGAKVLIGHHRAHSPIMAKAREVVASGQLGRLVTVVGSATFYKPDQYYADAPWRKEPGAGPILLNMIHEVHNLRMLCGDIVAVQAFASMPRAISRWRTPWPSTCVLPTGRWARSCCRTPPPARAAGSRPRRRTRPIRATTTKTATSSAAPTAASRCRPCGSRPTRGRKTARGGNRSTGTVGMVRDDPLKHQIEHFGAVVRGEAQPLVSARDGLLNLRVTEAIAEAAKTGQVVQLAAQ
jgi:predicted dehydrogenase